VIRTVDTLVLKEGQYALTTRGHLGTTHVLVVTNPDHPRYLDQSFIGNAGGLHKDGGTITLTYFYVTILGIPIPGRRQVFATQDGRGGELMREGTLDDVHELIERDQRAARA